jgi:hypothetical protein
MNRIVKAHYPVSALPEDLRQGLDPAADITVIIEEAEPQKNTCRLRNCSRRVGVPFARPRT